MRPASLAAILPILAFLFAFTIILRTAKFVAAGRLHGAFVLAAVAWGAFVTLVTELLSLVGGLTPGAVSAVWLVACAVLGLMALRTDALLFAWGRLKETLLGLGVVERVSITAIGFICAALFAVALISPPNNFDTMFYHLPRVLHWQQNASLRPYPALVDHQLNKPIWAETAILHLRLLWGTDRPVNLIQWFSMVGSLVVVAGIAALLKAGRRGQLLAVAFCVSIPMGVLQAATAQNDYVAAFWAACVAYLVVMGISRRLTAWEYAALATAVGLGALTKGTFFVYSPVFVAWLMLHELRSRRFRTAIGGALLIAGVAAVLNAGFWYRNIRVFGGPYGTSDWIQQNLWIRFLPQTPEEQEPASRGADTLDSETAVPTPSVRKSYWVRLAQTAGRNLTAPTRMISGALIRAVAMAPGVYGEDYEDELEIAIWNHEDFAGNPIHLLFVPLALPFLLVIRGKTQRILTLAYAAVSLLTYALLPIVIGHAVGQPGIRYQLSFFVLWSPVVGATFGLLGRKGLTWLLTAGFLVAAIPWVLFSNMRPLVGAAPGRTRIDSILVEEQKDILFALNPGLADDYILTAQAIQGARCSDVGLSANPGFLEYPLWWALGAPQSGVRIEFVDIAPELEPYVDASFKPCAVVCAICDEQQVYHGLPIFGTYDSIKLYMAE